MCDTHASTERCCVVIPFKNRRTELLRCVSSLFQQLSENTRLVLVDDGSDIRIDDDDKFKRFFDGGLVQILRHPSNCGVAASRNTGIKWCREQGFDIVIMTDSDCIVPANFIQLHMDLQRKYTDVPVIGSSGRGFGSTSFWGHLDYIMSWFHIIPGTPEREVLAPYSVATANISIKVQMLPFEGDFFETYLHTGEDTAFINKVRDLGFKVIFSPEPEILHEDRGSFSKFLEHQCEFSQHHYFVYHLKFGLEKLCRNGSYRMFFIPTFFVVLPFYALMGCYFNMSPWVRHKPKMFAYIFPVFGIWLLKGYAVLHAAWDPARATRPEGPSPPPHVVNISDF